MENAIKIFLLLSVVGINNLSYSQNGVGIGTTSPHSSSILEISSTSKGLLIPRMSTIERIAITTPATGLQVYDTTTNSQWFYNGTTWVQVAVKADSSKWTNDAANTRVAITNLSDGTTPRPVGKEFVITDDGKVGIGTANPDASSILNLDVTSLPSNDKKGFLGPKVALNSPTDITTIPSPAVGLLVYNTGTGTLATSGY